MYLYRRIIILALLFFVFIMRFSLQPYFHAPSTYGFSDFTVFYAASVVVNQGENPYTKQPIKKTIRNFRPYDAGWRFFYSPPVAVALIPMSYVPIKIMKFMWYVISLVALGTVGYLLQQLYAPKRAIYAWSVFLILISLYGAIGNNLRLGQINVFLLFFLVLHLFMLSKDKKYLAGVFLAALSIVKIFPFILIGYYALRGQWKVILSSILTTIGLFIGSIAVLGIEVHQTYLKKLSNSAIGGLAANLKEITAFDNATVYGGSVRALTFFQSEPVLSAGQEIFVSGVRFGILGILGMTIAYMTWNKRNEKPSIIDISLWIGLVLLGLTEIHTQYYVLWIPLFFYVFVYSTFSSKKFIIVENIIKNKVQVSLFLFAFLLIAFSFMRYLPSIIRRTEVTILPFALIGSLIIFGLCIYNTFFNKKNNNI